MEIPFSYIITQDVPTSKGFTTPGRGGCSLGSAISKNREVDSPGNIMRITQQAIMFSHCMFVTARRTRITEHINCLGVNKGYRKGNDSMTLRFYLSDMD